MHAEQPLWIPGSLCFLLMLTVFMVTTGRLGDICGRLRVFYVGVLVFAVASFLAGTAESAGKGRIRGGNGEGSRRIVV
jgi:MFS family permease